MVLLKKIRGKDLAFNRLFYIILLNITPYTHILGYGQSKYECCVTKNITNKCIGLCKKPGRRKGGIKLGSCKKFKKEIKECSKAKDKCIKGKYIRFTNFIAMQANTSHITT